jgi:hypothetical protein
VKSGLLVEDEEVPDGESPALLTAHELELRLQGDQHRSRVRAGSRGAEIATDGCSVADLLRGYGPGGLADRGAVLFEQRRRRELSMSRHRSDREPAVFQMNRPQLRNPGQRDDIPGAALSLLEIHQKIGPSGKQQGAFAGLEDPADLLEGAGPMIAKVRDVHAPTLSAGTASLRQSDSGSTHPLGRLVRPPLGALPASPSLHRVVRELVRKMPPGFLTGRRSETA